MLTRVATNYQHVQASPASTWTIEHNLNDYPIVDVIVDGGGFLVKLMPTTVTYVDEMTCVLTFSTPRSGYASVV